MESILATGLIINGACLAACGSLLFEELLTQISTSRWIEDENEEYLECRMTRKVRLAVVKIRWRISLPSDRDFPKDL